MRLIPQKRHDECGLACLLMLLQNYNFMFSYTFLRSRGKFKSFYDMHIFLKTHDIKHKMFYADFLSLSTFPVLAVLRYPRRIHFIIVWKKDASYVFYSDPANIKITKKKTGKIVAHIGTEYLSINSVNKAKVKKTKSFFYLPYKIKFLLLIGIFCWILYKFARCFAII